MRQGEHHCVDGERVLRLEMVTDADLTGYVIVDSHLFDDDHDLPQSGYRAGAGYEGREHDTLVASSGHRVAVRGDVVGMAYVVRPHSHPVAEAAGQPQEGGGQSNA